MLTMGSASSGDSTDATSLAANLFSVFGLSAVSASVRSGSGLPYHVYVHQDRVTWEQVGVGEVWDRCSQDRSEYCQGVVHSRSQDVGLLVRDMESLICCTVLIHLDCKTEPAFQICV